MVNSLYSENELGKEHQTAVLNLEDRVSAELERELLKASGQLKFSEEKYDKTKDTELGSSGAFKPSLNFSWHLSLLFTFFQIKNWGKMPYILT